MSESLGVRLVIGEPCSPENPNLCFALALSARTRLAVFLALFLSNDMEVTPVY